MAASDKCDRLRVAVLTGGTSAEREVCLMSGRKVFAALDSDRFQASLIDLATITRARAGELARILFTPAEEGEEAAAEPSAPDVRPDVVFIALHGGAGEDGSVQAMLDLLDIPYTGSGVLASAMALHKPIAKKLFEREGIPTPRWTMVREAEDAARLAAEFGLPCVVKPASEGSSLGVTIVREEAQLRPALELAWRFGREALVEEFISGVEISAPVLGNDDPEVLPIIEIVPGAKYEFYDYEAKYTPGATEEIIPARISEEKAARARELTLAAHRLLGCRGMSRVDMIAAEEEVYVLELQTIPGLTETSLLPRAAEAAGLPFPRLVERLIELALEGRGRRG